MLRCTVLYCVFQERLPDLVLQALAAAAPIIERMRLRAFDDMYYNSTTDTSIKLSKGIQGCLTDQIFRYLSKPFDPPAGFVLEEASHVQARRAELNQQLQRLEIAQDSINHIQEAVCTSTTVQGDLLGLQVPSQAASCSAVRSASQTYQRVSEEQPNSAVVLTNIRQASHVSSSLDPTNHSDSTSQGSTADLPASQHNSPTPLQGHMNHMTEDWSFLSSSSTAASTLEQLKHEPSINSENGSILSAKSARLVPRVSSGRKASKAQSRKVSLHNQHLMGIGNACRFSNSLHTATHVAPGHV